MEDKELLENFNTSSIYQITVKGKVGSLFLKSMNGMSVSHNKSHNKTISTITGEVVDQSALSGILNTFFDYQYTVISVLKLG